MFGCLALLAVASATATVPAGVPLRVALEHRVHIKRAGQPIQGKLMEPVYVFDRTVLPAGAVVEGHVTEIGGVSFGRRLAYLMSGNFTPPRDVRADFDALTLPDGSRLALRTEPSRGTAYTARVTKRGKPAAAFLAFKTPGKLRRLEMYALGMLPYHQQAWSAGTLFSGVLRDPVTAPLTPGPPEPESQELHARLLAPISSASAHRGSPVEAIVTRPQFSADHRLLIPEGSRLVGEVVKSQKARFFHRHGKLLFEFRQVQVPAAPAQSIQGYLDAVDADWSAHLALDSEGAMQPASPKSRFIFPLIASAVAGLSFHQDFNAKGVPDQDVGGRAESGAVGLGLIGTVLTQFGPRSFASGVAIAGAAFSLYSNFIARGQDVVLPANTPVTVGLGSR